MLASSGCVVIKKTTSETLFILTCSLSSATYTISIKLLSNSFNIKFCTMSITKQWVEDAIEECTEMIIS